MTDESTQSARVRTDRARETGPALETHFRFLTWLIPAVERFPRSQKFLLGDRIQTSGLDVLERLIEATYSKRRGDLLAGANLGIEKLRFLFRLAHHLRYLDRRRYEHAVRSLDETGRLVGGWRKAHHAREGQVTCSLPNGFRVARTLASGSRRSQGGAGRAFERPGTVMMKKGDALLAPRERRRSASRKPQAFSPPIGIVLAHVVSIL